jgi:hypothetical protein
MEIKNKLAFYHNKAKQYIKASKLKEARDYLDMGIVVATMNGKNFLPDEPCDDDYVVEGHTVAKWKMRFWVMIENNNLDKLSYE